jgi:hypothetical protein
MQQIPMAGSTMDQIETLEVTKRKSTVRFTLRMYAMRIITVSPALFPLPKHQHSTPNCLNNEKE